MATFYVGKRPVLKGRSANTVNPYTHKVGTYSNWDLFSTEHVLDGAPDHNHIPGSGPYGQGDVLLSRWFLGLETSQRKSSLKNSGILHPDVYSGRWVTELYRGVPSAKVFSGTWGHAFLLGPMAEYAGWSNYIYSGIPVEQALATSTLGHPIRYPSYATASNLGPDRSTNKQASTFGAYGPYVNKGVATAKSNPMGPGHTGHPDWPSSVVADAMPADYGQIPAPRATVEHYGFEHVQQWFGVPSAKAL